jgi:hypothetical protein
VSCRSTRATARAGCSTGADGRAGAQRIDQHAAAFAWARSGRRPVPDAPRMRLLRDRARRSSPV